MVERRDRAPLPALSGSAARLAEAVRAGLARGGVGPADRLVVAASGGLDSMALAHTLVEIGQPIVLVHIDHGLRSDSGEDSAFVGQQGAQLGVEVVRVGVAVGPGNVQARARRARYAALADVARQRSCRVVATGHTATDQAETVLMALVRGAGLRGLAGMPDRRELAEGVELVRPMLRVPRAEVEAAASEAGWPWREDPSNAASAYQRNRLRHGVLPLLREEGGAEVDARIAAAAQSARGALDVVRRQTLPESGPLLPLDPLAGLSAGAQRVVLAEALATWAPQAARSSALVERVRRLLGQDAGAHVASGGVRVWRERDALRIEPDASDADAGVLAVAPLAAVPDRFGADPLSEVVDLDRAGDVTVRLWREGDRLRPLGMDGSTRVSDLLRERGVPRALRAGVPVVVRGDEVLWVVGHRLAASVAVRPETVRAGRWTWRPTDAPG